MNNFFVLLKFRLRVTYLLPFEVKKKGGKENLNPRRINRPRGVKWWARQGSIL